MLTLAIQTAAGEAQIALLEDDRLLAERSITERLAVCRELTQEISSLLNECDKTPKDVGLVAVCLGPGSFTGIRIGVATAKAFAHALSIPIVGLNSLETLAFGVGKDAAPILAFLPAGKGRYFAACYGEALALLKAPAIISTDDLRAWASQAAPSKLIICSQLDTQLEKLAAETGAEVRAMSPAARALGQLGWQRFKEGILADPITLTPFYLRASSPEERAEEKV